jgi:hypothetical protein
MVPISEHPQQDPTDSNLSTPFHRQYWQQAVVQIAESLAPHGGDRLSKALKLVLANAVTIEGDGTAKVRSEHHTYTITKSNGCTCKDARRHTRFCKHAFATLIHRRATALLQDIQPIKKLEASGETTTSAVPKWIAWQIQEAPVACTLTFVCKGVDVHLTLRDVSDDALFARIKHVLPKIQQKVQTPSGAA